MLRKLNLISLLSLALLTSCNNKSNEINQTLEKEYQVQFNDGYLVLISEFDCSTCVNRLKTILNELSEENVEFAGLYQQKNKNNIFIYSDVINQFSHINWKRIQNESTYYLFSEQSDNKKGPFLVKIENGVYKEVISASDK